MPENLEEKEKCLEKLSQMQKFLPFLDFMIDKIQKKNNETSLSCQLGKFHFLRSMIAEKNGKYSWNVIVKVEDVIEKLIHKLGYKDPSDLRCKESFKQKSKDKESKVSDLFENKISMAAAVSVIPSSTTTTISVSSASSSPQVTTVDSKPSSQNSSTKSVDLIMKTLKISVTGSKKKSTDSDRGKKDLSNNLSPSQVATGDKSKSDEVSEKTLETDLDKDLDGFDLPECSVFSDADFSNNAANSTSTVPEKVSSQDDLLSSSREKLLKSLQKKLNLPRTDRASSQSSAESITGKLSDAPFSISAFSQNRNRTHSDDGKTKSESETRTNSENSALDKPNSDANQGTKSVHLTQPPKSFYVDNLSDKKGRNDADSGVYDYNAKQKLREKLSADICEVYRVAGKSVGGSLRSLKDHKRTSPPEDEELFKPDKLTAGSNRGNSSGISRLSGDIKNKQTEKCQKKPSILKNVDKKDESLGDKKSLRKHSGDGDENADKKREEKQSKYSEIKSTGTEHGKSSKSYSEKKSEKNLKDAEEQLKKEKKAKSFDLDNLDDNELSDFVKENNQFLPHLSKLKPLELRKAVKSSFPTVQDAEEISEDSFQDLDEFINVVEVMSATVKSSKENAKSKTEDNEKHPLVSVKKSVVGSDDVATNAKVIVEPQKSEKVLDSLRSKTPGLEDIDSLDDEDFAQKLIDETTPQILPAKKKKGLLELPLPWTEAVLDEVSSPESPDYSPASPETRDPRLKKSELPFERSANTKVDPRITSKSHYSSILKESIYTMRPQGSIGPQNSPGRITQNIRTCEPPLGNDKADVWHPQTLYLHQDGGQFPKFNSRYPVDLNDHKFRNPNPFPISYGYPLHSNDSKGHNHNLNPVPKSYAEYKRLKLQEQEKVNQLEQSQKEKPKNVSSDSSTCEASPPLQDKDENDRSNPSKTQENRQHPNVKDSHSSQRNQKNYHSSNRPHEDRKKTTDKRWHSDYGESKSREDCRGRKTNQEEVRKDEEERKKKVDNDRRQSLESEELISPLERLYQGENKPKTGRGYGLQNFKIPKKVREPATNESTKSNFHKLHKETTCSDATRDEAPARVSCTESEASKESSEIEKDVGNGKQANAADTTKKNELGKGDGKTETNKSGGNAGEDGKQASSFSTESQVSSKVQCHTEPAKEAKNVTQEISNSKQTNGDEVVGTKSETKTAASNESRRNWEAQISECQSSAESTNLKRKSPVKESQVDSDRNALVLKEEITQEFVEALIRKSFQSGEGKLLLAQAKLFEEFARKLNSKKLKTIQKIINSESDSSSSSSDASTEEEKKKKKMKKSEEKKSKKRKKRVKKIKKLKSSSSSSESEGNNEGEDARKKEEETSKESESTKFELSDGPTTPKSSEEGKSTSAEQTSLDEFKGTGSAVASTPLKSNPTRTKKRRKAIDFGRCISRRKTQRKQGQKKLLEQILNETPQQENVETPGSEVSGKESEQKSKPKTKGKVKTELDRLHDDIRSMFISSGVVTATGQRMCRILKESGGNMNNLDIVKESAKMVEEEKLKKVQTRVTSKKVTPTINPESKGRSWSSDKISARDRSKSKTRNENHSEDVQSTLEVEMRKKKPYVVLERADLDNFGYGVKISDNCISFSRRRGCNKAIRGRGWRGVLAGKLPSRSSWFSDLERNVFLARNKRKFERMKGKNVKKSYVGKKIMDVVKNLPLRMSKMKHLEIREKKSSEKMKETKKRKTGASKTNRRRDRRNKAEGRKDLLGDNILNYAFEKRQLVYPCRLCTNVTRNITSHYKVDHPESEVLISRLSKTEAKKAIADSKRNCYDTASSEQGTCPDTVKPKVKSKASGAVAYHCRMCNLAKVTDVNAFFGHVSSHTGEYRFRCPSEGCGVTLPHLGNVKFHILSKHAEDRFGLYSSVIELFPVPAESDKLFGHLCSECNFVQICRTNVENHVKTQHPSVENVEIIKIDMSWKRVERSKNSQKNKNSEKCSKKGTEGVEGKTLETEETSYVDVKTIERVEERGSTPTNGATADEASPEKTRQLRKRKLEPVGVDLPVDPEEPSSKSPDEDDIRSPVAKKLVTDVDPEEKAPEENSADPKSDSTAADVDVFDQEKKNADGAQLVDEDSEADVDLNNISSIRGSDIIDSIEINDRKESLDMLDALFDNIPDGRPGCTKWKVGPLEAQTLENSEVLYECYIKGCLFSTRVYDLFEKHIKISHSTEKWDGICNICNICFKDEKAMRPRSLKLIYALKHLKFHQCSKSKDAKFTAEDSNSEQSSPKSPKGSIEDDEDSSGLCINMEEATEPTTKAIEEGDQSEGKSESGDAPFPVKPLLRVRNLFGDRLSKPKDQGEEDSSVSKEGQIIGEEKTESESKADAPAMFTIENVRSLNQDEKKEVQPKQVRRAVKIEVPKTVSGKPVLVRSCPTRKIALQPEGSAIPIEVGHVQLLKTPTSRHSVVLGSLTNSSPIRLISSLPPGQRKKKFTVKPVMVSASLPILGDPSAVSVIHSVPSATITTTNALPITIERITSSSSAAEESSAVPQSVVRGRNSTDSVKISTKRTTVYRPGRSASLPSAEVEELEQKDAVLQRLHSSPSVGNKSVKDAKIYQEMLNKTKLCHLFKCMAIECSFTCNSESVFTQHIGLHEAQRRMKGAKNCMKKIYLDNANKMKKVFNWQQCAYCCEVLVNTSSALSQHILTEHGHCIYQCAYCFYRAVSQSYVEIHQNLAHSQTLKSNSRVIYKCKQLSGAPPPVNALEKQGRRQSVRPYHCDQCGCKFFITQEFMNHLTTEHQSVTAYTCHICKNLCFKADRLITHYKLHSYCTYQCAYCLHGTETEKEMVFHLCNFHFSQPAYMYVRALAEVQSDEGLKRSNKKKKSNNSQLDSLKVILYESETLSPDCLVEADEEEEVTNDATKSFDFSAIVAELGLNPDTSESTSVSPIMKELACIGTRSPGGLSLKSLLPNAQFSSENENENESCSVLISSGLSATSNEERDMNIPLGQLPLEAVNIHNKKENSPGSSPANIGSPDKNLKLNEIIINLQHKEKNFYPNSEEEKNEASVPAVPSATHKLPPVVVTRKSRPKNVYPPKNSNLFKKKPEELGQGVEEGNLPLLYQILSCDGQTDYLNKRQNVNHKEREKMSVKPANGDKDSSEGTAESEKLVPADQPIITSVVSLFNRRRSSVDEEMDSGSLIISDVCSISRTEEEICNNPSTPSKIVINIQSKGNSPPVLEPPIIRVEDFPVSENETENQSFNNKSTTEGEDSSFKIDPLEDNLDVSVPSPDVIILEEEKTTKDILTVTLDSEDEKENEESSKTAEVEDTKASESVKSPGNIIRKEMELLRSQIVNETDCLLFDDVAETEKATPEVPLTIKPVEQEASQIQSLLSPIEEAICSLNKKLQSETRKNQEKEEEEKNREETQKVESVKRAEGAKSAVPELPRTRSGVRDRSKREDTAEKSDSDDGTAADGKKDDKNKKFREGLARKELFICGNEKCSFAAEEDSSLKDHLYVCDLSRDSSMLSCPHCSKQIKQSNAYIEHLKHHGEKKFHCGLCSFTSAVEHSMTRHVKQKHKCSVLKTLPKDPPKEGHVVFYPKNYKVEKQDFEVNGYSPGDEDKLPLQSVYQVNVKCAKCPYFTKVRSNMVRHLKIHVKSVETEGVVVVPSTAPTNPVPCLDAKERMFDKMTNLAASSQLAQAKEKIAIEALSPEEEAKLPQFVAEQMRYKCCLPDCNYITIDEGMLKHHIKALHDEISYYSCPHCKATVHVDVRHVTLDKLGHHLKHHDSKLYKCAHCIYFHYQRSFVEKHTIEKHPDRRYYVHTVREPKADVISEEEQSQSDAGAKAWKCGLCEDFQSPSRASIMDHLARKHNTKSKYKCQLCYMKSNHYQSFFSHFASKHAGEKVAYVRSIIKISSNPGESGSSGADSSNEHFDTTPLWQRGAPRVRHIRGILIEEEEVRTKKSKRMSLEKESEPKISEAVTSGNAFYCPLCSDKKKTFYTRNADCFRSHLYQELNYQQFACILCGKMFVDKKEFDKHHTRMHPDKPQSLKQTKEDGEIMFWVDKVIAKQREQMQGRKRRLSEEEPSQGLAKKKKEV